MKLGALLFSLAVLAVAVPPNGARAEGSIFEVARVRLGVVPLDQARPAAQRVEPFRRYLADQLRLPVEVVTVADARGLADGLAEGRIDLAAMSAAAFVATERGCKCLETLAVPRAADGSTAWRSVMVVRADSAAHSLADLKGASLALPPRRSFAGNVVPLAALARQKIDPRGQFSRIEPATGPLDAVRLLADRKVDAALTWMAFDGAEAARGPMGPIAQLAIQRRLDPASFRVVWMTDPVPHGPVVARAALPTPLRTKLRDILLGLKDSAPDAYEALELIEGGGYVPIGASAYEPLGVLLSEASAQR